MNQQLVNNKLNLYKRFVNRKDGYSSKYSYFLGMSLKKGIFYDFVEKNGKNMPCRQDIDEAIFYLLKASEDITLSGHCCLFFELADIYENFTKYKDLIKISPIVHLL